MCFSHVTGPALQTPVLGDGWSAKPNLFYSDITPLRPSAADSAAVCVVIFVARREICIELCDGQEREDRNQEDWVRTTFSVVCKSMGHKSWTWDFWRLSNDL